MAPNRRNLAALNLYIAYSIMSVKGLLICARLVDQVGVDWRGFATPDRRSLYATVAYLAFMLTRQSHAHVLSPSKLIYLVFKHDCICEVCYHASTHENLTQ